MGLVNATFHWPMQRRGKKKKKKKKKMWKYVNRPRSSKCGIFYNVLYTHSYWQDPAKELPNANFIDTSYTRAKKCENIEIP